ncbi:MAG: hypothetical protein CSB47_02435 [Proteobacteria bacterium]|nr:MAG: hypothetical protein CSB47_02435 [Pseudomonadota bacterium]
MVLKIESYSPTTVKLPEFKLGNLMNKNNMKSFTMWLFSLAFLSLIRTAYAEDIEIFQAEIPPSKPNILMVLDQSGSMKKEVSGRTETRSDALRRAFNGIMSDSDFVGVRVGLMGFGNGHGRPFAHGVSFPVSNIDDLATPIMLSNVLPYDPADTSSVGYFSLSDDVLPDPLPNEKVREFLPRILGSWYPYGNTPLVDALYEAALYFRGERPKWGLATPEQNHAAHPSTYRGAPEGTVNQSVTGGKVICETPDADCGTNCVPVTQQGLCEIGTTSCGLGTNCTTSTETWSMACTLGSEADCLASNPRFTSCRDTSSTNCSSGTEAEAAACSTNRTFICQFPQVATRCDYQKYSCDEVQVDVNLNTDIVYESPITDKCEDNAIVLLSDGKPYVPDRTAFAQTMVDVKALTGSTTDCVDPGDGRCGVEIAKFLSTVDQSDIVSGENLINTYTIGFDMGAGSEAERFLKSVAQAGGGQFFHAADAEALTAVFKHIIEDVSKTARSYSAPTYTVDQKSLLSHSNSVYIPMFENSDSPSWAGNLKKFKLNSDGQIIDKNNAVAVNTLGVLNANAVDFWEESSAPTPGTGDTEGRNPVTSGGVASHINPDSRKILTDNGSDLVALDASSVSKAALAGDATSGATISDTEYTAMLRFIKGYNADGTTRHHLGDILHGKPLVVSYGSKEVIFVGTNEGFVHAINAGDASSTGGGDELFAYMPSELLSNISAQYRNKPLSGSVKHIYGVDGEMTVWLDDKNKNGQVDAGDGEKAYLYFGLRRGGNAYYALDITNPESPALMWRINNDTAGFGRLAQSWSRLTPAKLRYKASVAGDAKYEGVLVFGGGYDASVYDQEDPADRAAGAAKGNGVYVVNAKTGALIWSHVGGDLKHSVAGNIRLLDLDRNGSIDRLYFGDLGGNVWRADLNMDDIDDDESLNDVKNDARIYKLASLGGGTNSRMFFYEPDVSLFKHKGQLVTLIAIGSGYRSHPQNTSIQDRFYVLQDENAVHTPETPPAALTHSDLVSRTALAGADFMPDHKGWYLDLANGSGEKSLSSPLIFMNKVMFTTFGPSSTPTSTGGEDSCTYKSSNVGRAYVLDLVKAKAVVDLDDDDNVTDSDISTVIGVGDIPDSPKLVFNEPSNCSKTGCDQFVDVRVGRMQKPLINRNTKDGNINLGDLLPKVFWLDAGQ